MESYLSKLRDYKNWSRLFSADIRNPDGHWNFLQLFRRIPTKKAPIEYYVINDNCNEKSFKDRTEAITEYMRRYRNYQCSFFSVSDIRNL